MIDALAASGADSSPPDPAMDLRRRSMQRLIDDPRRLIACCTIPPAATTRARRILTAQLARERATRTGSKLELIGDRQTLLSAVAQLL